MRVWILLAAGACAACGADYTRPSFGAPHVLTGYWLGESPDYVFDATLTVKDSSRSDPSGQVPSKFVRGAGRYARLGTGAETTYVVPPYEVRFQQQLEPFTLTLWSYATPSGASRTLQFRGVVLNPDRLSGWLIRTHVVPSGGIQLDSVAVILMRDGT